MKPETMPVFLHPITPRSHYPHARAARRRALFLRVFVIACTLATIGSALAAFALKG